MLRLIKNSSIAFIVILLFISQTLSSEEGMIPLSEINKLDLKALGFQIESSDLYNPNGVSLIDAIINLSGCTASFVSPDGLILTNYHCAFNAVQAVTTEKNDYLQNGFIAMNRGEELQAKGVTARVIESYRDVSNEILSVIKPKMSFTERTKAIEKKTKNLIVETEKKFPGRRAEVAEMFIGKTYILFIYTYLKDIRLVYAPPRSIGEYGGEIDNWMWPRHTGDFTVLRAYTAKNGSFDDYSPENIPYHPKKHLQVAPEGVKEEDIVFVLGYPGTTNRHRPADFVSFEEEVRMPYMIGLYEWMINTLERMSLKNRSTEIKLAPQLKGIWNNAKRTKGQLEGLTKLKLTDKMRKNEQILQKFIDEKPDRQKKYGQLLTRIQAFYSEKRKDIASDSIFGYIRKYSILFNIAFTLYEASIERKKADTDRESLYMDRNFDKTKKNIEKDLNNYDEETDKTVFKEFLVRSAQLPDQQQITAVTQIVSGGKNGTIDAFLENAYKQTQLKDLKFVMGLFEKSTEELKLIPDPFLQFAVAFYSTFKQQKEKEKRQKGELDELLSHFIDIKKEFLGKEFIPDANSTFRLTYGHIRGYSPADAVYYRPFTTLKGLIEKNTGIEPFSVPPRLIKLFDEKNFGSFQAAGLNDIPVAMLYDTDTTGGNSGSPVLDAKGRMVGLNFDRVYQATINDYAWDKSYSRSIGLDIRFVLWFLDKFGGARYLLEEMKIEE